MYSVLYLGKVAASLLPGVPSLRLKQRNEYRVTYAFSDIAISFLMAERFVAQNAKSHCNQSIVLEKAGVSGLCKHVCAVDLPLLQFRDLFGLIISIGTVVAVNAANSVLAVLIFVVQTANYMKQLQ